MMNKETLSVLLAKPYVRYLIVGGVSAFVDFSVYILVYFGGAIVSLSVTNTEVARIFYANSWGTLAGFSLGFFLQRVWAFKSNAEVAPQFLAVCVLLVFNTAAGSYLISLLHQVMPVPVSKILIQALVVFWNFWVYKLIIFKR